MAIDPPPVFCTNYNLVFFHNPVLATRYGKVVSGACTSYKVSPEVSISLDVRYSLGLTNMPNDKGKQNYGNDQSIKPTGFQIAVGAMFNL